MGKPGMGEHESVAPESMLALLKVALRQPNLVFCLSKQDPELVASSPSSKHSLASESWNMMHSSG